MDLLVDANVFIAAVNPQEIHYARAREILTNGDRIILTDIVANETMNVIARRQTKALSILTMGNILQSNAHIEHMRYETFMTALKLFSAWKPASFADAANIAVMKSLGITRIATFDQAFKNIPGIEVIS